MEVQKIECFAELHDILQSLRDKGGYIFRGHRDCNWSLVPKAGRSKNYLRLEKTYFDAWKRRAIEHMRQIPPNDWEWLAVAQHHGFFTRLLDWSANPLVAAFFAVSGEMDTVPAIYAFCPKKTLDAEQKSPFIVDRGVTEYRPSAFSSRISSQNARFTLHHPADTDLIGTNEYGDLKQILIEKNYVLELVRELDQYGYNYATIFPDLDGISKYLNWYASVF